MKISCAGPAQSLLTLSDGLLSTAFGVKANVITNLRTSMTQYPLIRPLSEPVSAPPQRRLTLRPTQVACCTVCASTLLVIACDLVLAHDPTADL